MTYDKCKGTVDKAMNKCTLKLKDVECPDDSVSLRRRMVVTNILTIRNPKPTKTDAKAARRAERRKTKLESWR